MQLGRLHKSTGNTRWCPGHVRFASKLVALQQRARRGASRRETAALVTGAAAVAIDSEVEPGSSAQREAVTFPFACPICQTTEFSLQSSYTRPVGSQSCSRCARQFNVNGPFIDLTLESSSAQGYQQTYWGGTEIFRHCLDGSPLVSWVYERGWRQNFRFFGFPGPDEELRIALGYFQPVWGEVLLDLSCGSGLFSRRFAKSGNFKGVIAGDFSENMLKQASQFFVEDSTIDPSEYMLARMDAGRLPFATGSLAAIHAGAAMHCWPNPTAAVAEISRVLRPGGMFVASTILDPSARLGEFLGDEAAARLSQLDPLKFINGGGGMPYKWWQEQELRQLTAQMGLQDFVCQRNNRFILFSVRKPS